MSQFFKDWEQSVSDIIAESYKKFPERAPQNFNSMDEAIKMVTEMGKIKKESVALAHGRKVLKVEDVADVIVSTVAVTCVPTPRGNALAIYDYDKCVYTYELETVLNDYVVALMGSSSQSTLASMELTLLGLRRRMAYYNPLPDYKIAVGNGIYNCVTKELEPFTPKYTVLTKIKTNLVKGALPPKYEDGFTFEGMLDSLSNYNEDRRQLLTQICKSILTGQSLKPAMFIVLGKGGDGKSTFFTMLANMLGQDNVAYMNFSEMDSPDKMLETMNKKMVLGLDNDVNIYIKKTAVIKTMATHEVMTLSRKFLPAISVKFTGTVVQLCNEFPRIAETGSSMKRRLVPFKAENSHYENRTENDNIDTLYIKDERFLEYALWYLMNEDTTPYFSDFNDVDRSVVNSSLESEDTLGQFIAEIEQLGVLSSDNNYLPYSHLYSAYLDWVEQSYMGQKPMSSRNFSMKIAEKLEHYGYGVSDSKSVIRPKSLESANEYLIRTWGSAREYTNLKQAIDLNKPSRVLQKVGESRVKTEVRRFAKPISVISYFSLDTPLGQYAMRNNLESDFEAYKKDMNNDVSSKVKAMKQEVKQEKIEEEKQRELMRAILVPPIPFNEVVESPNDDTRKQTLEWLSSLELSYKGGDVPLTAYISKLDNLMGTCFSEAYNKQDPLLIAICNDMENSDSLNRIDLLKDFIKQVE